MCIRDRRFTAQYVGCIAGVSGMEDMDGSDRLEGSRLSMDGTGFVFCRNDGRKIFVL